MDVVASCAESRDQRRGREKMRARGGTRRKRRRRRESGQERSGRGSISVRITNKMKVTVFLLGGQQRSVSLSKVKS